MFHSQNFRRTATVSAVPDSFSRNIVNFFGLQSRALASLMLLFFVSSGVPTAHAGELDDETDVTNRQVELAQDLPQTLVVRVSEDESETAVLHMDEALPADASIQETIAKLEFTRITPGAASAHELDQDGSRSSWYFYFNYWNYRWPTYSYYGYHYSYQNYYWYRWGGYSYYFYRWRRW